MTTSEDTLAFYLTVYHVAAQCPKGRVTTYGHLAYVAGKPNNSRQVGQALKTMSRSPNVRYSTVNVPWWRVINASGRISNVEHREEQRERLVAELGKEPPYSLPAVGWFPEPEDVDLDFEPI